MNDELEIRLRNAFRSGSLPAAPGRLLDHLEEVAGTPLVAGSGLDGRSRRGRRPWGVLAVAAVLLLGGSAVALWTIGGGGPSRPPAAPSPSAAAPLVFAPQWTATTPFSDPALARAVSIVQQRIAATGLAGVDVTTDDQGRIVVSIPTGNDPEPVRRVVAPRGELAFVPLGDKQLETGAKLDLTAFPPLLGNADVAGSSVVDDQMGQPALQIQFTNSGGTTFGEYTASHIGSYFAIVMDGTVVSAPVINEGIPGGDVQISFVTGEADRTEIAQLAALIRFGPLPVPLVEVGGVPASSPG